MTCPECKTEIKDDSEFCSNCGTNIVQKQQKAPDTHTVINWQSFLSIISAIFFFFIVKQSFLDYGDFGVLSIMLLIGCGVLFIFGLLTLVHKEYIATCPYCGKTVNVVLNTEAFDCPICKERIIIENGKLSKKDVKL